MNDNVLERGTTHGLDYLIVGLPMGHRCGYVRVPVDHPWHGIHYDAPADGSAPREDDPYERLLEARVQVHGGLTWSGKLPPEEGWWLGFDCAHGGDAKDPSLMNDEYRETYGKFPDFPGAVIRTTAYVRDECDQLAKQIVRTHPMRGEQT